MLVVAIAIKLASVIECIASQISNKPSPISIWNRNSKVQSRNLPVPSLLILPTDLPLPLPSRLYLQPLRLIVTTRKVVEEPSNNCTFHHLIFIMHQVANDILGQQSNRIVGLYDAILTCSSSFKR